MWCNLIRSKSTMLQYPHINAYTKYFDAHQINDNKWLDSWLDHGKKVFRPFHQILRHWHIYRWQRTHTMKWICLFWTFIRTKNHLDVSNQCTNVRIRVSDILSVRASEKSVFLKYFYECPKEQLTYTLMCGNHSFTDGRTQFCPLPPLDIYDIISLNSINLSMFFTTTDIYFWKSRSLSIEVSFRLFTTFPYKISSL